MSLQVSLSNFRHSVTEIKGQISLAFQQSHSSSIYLFTQSQRNFIVDSAFLKIFIAWETYLEDSFINYMIGQPSITGTVVAKYASPRDSNHANEILIGTQSFVQWSRPDVVLKLSKNFFVSPDPFQQHIVSIYSELMDLKTIRNAAAHLSSTTSLKLDALASRITGNPVVGASVATLIFTIDSQSANNDTLFETYLTKLDIAAEGIAKA